MTRQPFIEAAVDLLHCQAADALVRQVAAVGEHLAEKRSATADEDVGTEDGISGSELSALLHACGLTPREFKHGGADHEQERDAVETAFATIATLLPGGESKTARLCFAVCLYPQRAYLLKDDLLPRLHAFAVFLEEYGRDHNAAEALFRYVARTLPTGPWNVADLSVLLADISGQDGPEAKDRAALHLGTCHAALLQLMHGHWAEDRDFVCRFRSFFNRPPSEFPIPPDGRNGLRDRVIKDTGPAHWDRATQLEGYARSYTKTRWYPGQSSDTLFRSAWEDIGLTRLSGPFPHYTFRSRFDTWWVHQMGHYRLPHAHRSFDDIAWRVPAHQPAGSDADANDSVPEPGAPDSWTGGDADDEHDTGAHGTLRDAVPEWEQLIGGGLSIDELRVYREGYRLVRTTFFKRDTGATDAVRRALDTLWAEYTERRLRGLDVPWGHLGPLLLATATREGMARDALESAFDRMRLRLWAYILGRTRRLGLDEILHIPRPRGYKDSGGLYPLLEVSGVETVATLARTTHFDNTLLWAFLAHVLLRVRFALNSRFLSDVWSYARLREEIQVWLDDPAFVPTLAHGASLGRPADKAAHALLETPPLRVAFGPPRPADRRVKDLASPRAYRVEVRAWLQLARTLVGARHFTMSARAWRRYLGCDDAVAIHWIVPVWYLAVVEKLEVDAVIAQLLVPRETMPAVRNMTENVKAYARARIVVNQHRAGTRVGRAALADAEALIATLTQPATPRGPKRESGGTRS